MKEGARVTYVDLDGEAYEAKVLSVTGDDTKPGPRTLTLQFEDRQRPGNAAAEQRVEEGVQHQSVVDANDPLPHWRQLDEPARTFGEETLREGQRPENAAKAAGSSDVERTEE